MIALSVGRGNDFTRILSLLEASCVTRQEVAKLSEKHGLADNWERFERKFFDE